MHFRTADARHRPAADVDSTPAGTIMCIGDSITQGGAREGDYTYRLLLQAMLNADFVGTQHGGLDPGVTWPPWFRPDHEGYYGATSAEVRDRLALSLAASPAPDVALIHLGTNDKRGETVASLETIIFHLRARNPHVRVYVGLLADGGWRAAYRRFRVSRMARRLGVATVRHAYDEADTFDGVHPNPAGQAKMAAAWYRALRNRRR